MAFQAEAITVLCWKIARLMRRMRDSHRQVVLLDAQPIAELDSCVALPIVHPPHLALISF